MLGIFADITARKQMERELARSKELAEAANRAKGDFLAAMSHELRTPLTMIISPVASLLIDRRSDLPPDVAEILDKVHRNANRLKALTDDVLDISKHQAGQLKLHAEPVRLGDHMRDLLADMEPAATARGLTLRWQGLDDSLGWVMLDVIKFDKVLINLVGNALKFTPRGGDVVVVAHVGEETLSVVVRDTGVGIDSVHHERLFRRFEQVDGGSTRRHGGTGLGLSLVKEFVELMGGEVRVESALGQGATFTVTIPRPAVAPEGAVAYAAVQQNAVLLALDASRSHEARAPAPPVSPDAPCVLVVEDNDDLRQYIAQLLGREFRVIDVGDGKAAIDRILVDRPDVIVSDVMMPNMNGFELVARLKADPELARIPILLLTARAGVESSSESLDQGADDYITKPFAPLDLVSRVRAAHRMALLHRQLRQAERRAENAERLAGLGRLLAKLSHELNNPTNVIYNGLIPIEQYANALVRYATACDRAVTSPQDASDLPTLRSALELDWVIEDMPAAVATLRDAARRIRDLQSDLSLFLGGKTGLRREQADLNELVASSVELIRRGTSVTLETELRLGDVPRFAFDRGRLGQVLVNVLKNAGEAVGHRGRVTVETSAGEGCVRIAISDSGSGVPESLRERIFEPFFTSKEVGVGTGLGLAVSRELLALHGGGIYLDTTYDRGARFVIELPITAKAGETGDAAAAMLPSRSSSQSGSPDLERIS